MKRKPLLLGLLALVVLATLVTAFLLTFERKDVTEQVAATGAARYNRFLALQQILQKMDLSATSLTTLDPKQMPLRPDDTLLLGGDLDRVDVDDARRIASWVRGGGHLLLAAGPSAAQTPLFEALQLLDSGETKRTCQTIEVHGATTDHGNVKLCGRRFRLRSGVAVEAAIGDAHDGYLFARSRLGKGAVSALVDLDLISRKQLKQVAAQRFAWRLLAPNRGRGKIYLVYALDGPPFLAVVGMKGWPALLALGLLLAGWMAMRSARLGPLMPAPSANRRALLEHIQAAGEFFYRRDSGHSLHRMVCQAVLGRLRRRDPASAWLVGDALYERLAQRGEFEPAQIAQAFQPPANAQAFCASIITLARLRSHP